MAAGEVNLIFQCYNIFEIIFSVEAQPRMRLLEPIPQEVPIPDRSHWLHNKEPEPESVWEGGKNPIPEPIPEPES